MIDLTEISGRLDDLAEMSRQADMLERLRGQSTIYISSDCNTWAAVNKAIAEPWLVKQIATLKESIADLTAKLESCAGILGIKDRSGEF